MNEVMNRRLHMGCGEPLVGIYSPRPKAPAVTRQPAVAGKRPDRSRQRGEKGA